MPLTGKQRRALRALGHHLKAVLQVGHQGVTPGLLAALEQALHDHELVKVRVLDTSPEPRGAVALQLATSSASEVAQVLGRTVLLYKPRAVDPKIRL
jgi:RNA-binding protein